ncbi:DUF4384 domain-containing protein [Treponema sp.]|uniref:DUF4384 domain-containing protein n=1 Tax=Treponema sp. TaxID=166 RepID=UPI003F0BEAD2
MKKTTLTVILALFVVFSTFAKTLMFEDLLNNAATEISADIDGKVESLAILDVKTEYWAISDYIVDELVHYFTRRFGSGNIIAHDEFTRTLIENEFEYQQSGAVSDDTIQQIGRELGVDGIIICEFVEVSSGWNLFVKAIHVETKKQISSWKGKIDKNDKEVRFQIEKSKKSSRPKIQISNSSSKQTAKKSELSIEVSMINEDGESISVVHPGDLIRFKVFSNKNAYLAILCVDAKNNEEWLPLEENYIRSGETRIFPDIPGAVLRVQEGIFGSEQIKVFACTEKSDLPKPGKIIGTRAFILAKEGSERAAVELSYKVLSK